MLLHRTRPVVRRWTTESGIASGLGDLRGRGAAERGRAGSMPLGEGGRFQRGEMEVRRKWGIWGFGGRRGGFWCVIFVRAVG